MDFYMFLLHNEQVDENLKNSNVVYNDDRRLNYLFSKYKEDYNKIKDLRVKRIETVKVKDIKGYKEYILRKRVNKYYIKNELVNNRKVKKLLNEDIIGVYGVKNFMDLDREGQFSLISNK